MGCGCGKVRNQSIAGTVLKTGNEADLVLNDAGMYDLYVAPGCTERYHGGLQAATVYIAGRGTDKEKMFIRTQFDVASEYARENDIDLIHVGVLQLCHEAVVELLGV